MTIEREYLPHAVERRWLERWSEGEPFRGDPDSGKQPFCMVIPPPNVTGNLHIGHVLVYTIHDIVARWRRMQGFDVLWLPGTDHAGIATQMVVERELAREGQSRREMGRAAFERRVWEWKETYGGKITAALRQLGSTVDWSRERFTLDEGLSRAVREVFVRLHREGLIYRDRYIVNWCPGCRTAISDLETQYRELEGKLYTIRYPGVDGGQAVRVATTRPETLLGDTAVAVNPDDDRFRALVGARVRVPLVDREVPVIADAFVDPAFGTGAVKITPGHDPNDFAAGRRHGLEELTVIDDEGKMTAAAGQAYAGLDRLEARKRVVADLQASELLEKVKPYRHSVGHCQRCSTMIEPLVSTQWFVKVAPLAAPAIEAVESGKIRFVPEAWSKTYFEWMRNIHDWCISRQLWWGHRIPAWYCDACSKTFVAQSAPAACDACGGELRQDEDVLDTWFSSALWPFSTLGWPERTRDLEHYYPTRLLITGHDIIFFWVARMIMMGLKFGGDVPFREVYIHGLVRDAEGQKMSKSKGNTVDPHEVQDRYGTDAVRFTMAILAAPGNDIPLDPQRMDGYRAFANKLWNACRFVLMKVGDAAVGEIDRDGLSVADRWILSRCQRAIDDVQAALEAYRFDRAADALYHFIWHQFCDWYIELVKPDFADDAPPERSAGARAVLVHVLDALLRLLHPVMPFITEELWQRLPASSGLLALAAWPEVDPALRDADAERAVDRLQQLVVKVRNLRVETNIDPSKRIELLLHADDERDRDLWRREDARIAALVRAAKVEVLEQLDETMVAARGVAAGTQIAIPLAGLLDFDVERSRLKRDLLKVEKALQSRAKKLNNAAFLEQAPPEVVAREREVHGELVDRKDRIEQHLALLGQSSR
jgi:valyl-tRNA synthetase